VKAAYTKCVRAVWAADGGQRVSAPPPTREFGSFLFARDSAAIRHGDRAALAYAFREVRAGTRWDNRADENQRFRV
jgi:hypothetical protein